MDWIDEPYWTIAQILEWLRAESICAEAALPRIPLTGHRCLWMPGNPWSISPDKERAQIPQLERIDLRLVPTAEVLGPLRPPTVLPAPGEDIDKFLGEIVPTLPELPTHMLVDAREIQESPLYKKYGREGRSIKLDVREGWCHLGGSRDDVMAPWANGTESAETVRHASIQAALTKALEYRAAHGTASSEAGLLRDAETMFPKPTTRQLKSAWAGTGKKRGRGAPSKK
jgi:hypothetical protein